MSDEPDWDLDVEAGSDQGLELTADLVRPYVITKGRELPSETVFSRTTLVTAAGDAGSRVLAPEARQVMQLVSGGHLSVAEVAGHTGLPLGVVRILLAQLEEGGLVTARVPAHQADQQLLTAVLNGLRQRFGA